MNIESNSIEFYSCTEQVLEILRKIDASHFSFEDQKALTKIHASLEDRNKWIIALNEGTKKPKLYTAQHNVLSEIVAFDKNVLSDFEMSQFYQESIRREKNEYSLSKDKLEDKVKYINNHAEWANECHMIGDIQRAKYHEEEVKITKEVDYKFALVAFEKAEKKYNDAQSENEQYLKNIIPNIIELCQFYYSITNRYRLLEEAEVQTLKEKKILPEILNENNKEYLPIKLSLEFIELFNELGIQFEKVSIYNYLNHFEKVPKVAIPNDEISRFFFLINTIGGYVKKRKNWTTKFEQKYNIKNLNTRASTVRNSLGEKNKIFVDQVNKLINKLQKEYQIESSSIY